MPFAPVGFPRQLCLDVKDGDGWGGGNNPQDWFKSLTSATHPLHCDHSAPLAVLQSLMGRGFRELRGMTAGLHTRRTKKRIQTVMKA